MKKIDRLWKTDDVLERVEVDSSEHGQNDWLRHSCDIFREMYLRPSHAHGYYWAAHGSYHIYLSHINMSELVSARYGKTKVRVFRVLREIKWHHVVEYNVEALLEGDIATR